MKYLNKILLATVLFSAASCTDYNMKDFLVDEPESLAQLEYLKDYNALKTYVDRTVNPNFKLGTGASLSDYNSKGLMYRMVNANYDEMTMGYEMKHGAVVQSDGSLVVSNIQTLIDNAKAAGTSIYGHTLCWHSNQNATYLNKLLAPTIIPGDGGAGGYSYKFTNTTAGNFWVSQLAYGLSPNLDNNTEYVLTFFVKGTASGNIRPEIQSSADYSSNSFGVVPVTTTWTKFELKTTTTKDTRNRFIISFGDYVGSVYIDNVTLCKSGSTTSIITGGDFENGVGAWGGWGSTSSRGLSALGEGYRLGDLIVEKTAEQKRVLVDGALEKWISGMLSATKDYVKVWDVVNEPMSDYPDPSQLKTGAGKTLAADEFYWQDYLGKDYAVRAIQLARKYGNADDKLFINDYGLEAADQKKCKGLIDYISYVESKGVKVDGIGTQMHVTCGQTTLDGVKAMLTNLAATGKLIKISELDMGYRAVGATANMLTDSVKFAQAQEMSVFYQQIVKAYFDIVPAAQRYGITHWSPLDSPKSSSWRAQEPIGLWTEKYYRKPAYGGFADGLAGKAVTTTTP